MSNILYPPCVDTLPHDSPLYEQLAAEQSDSPVELSTESLSDSFTTSSLASRLQHSSYSLDDIHQDKVCEKKISNFLCPKSRQIFLEPIICSDGYI